MHDNWQRMTNFQKVLSRVFLKLFAFVLMFSAGIMMPSQVFAKTEITEDIEPGRKMARQATKEKKLWITADHSRYELLKQKFTSGPEVTKTCLSCHNQAALQFHQTIHWTWMDPITEKSAKLGKGGLSINNF
jgi:hypothetical protein